MSSPKLVVASGLAGLALSACGGTAKPVAGTIRPAPTPHSRGVIDDPRGGMIKCLKLKQVQAVRIGRTGLQIGALPAGPTIDYASTPGDAQAAQIHGKVQSAEVIGSAFLYPNEASDATLQKVENCLTVGVIG
jgi:hypothetical protein